MRCAVIGDPASHSLSPAIHRAGYQQHGLTWDYRAVTVQAAELERFVTARRDDPQWAGLSVTAPHKQALLELGEPDAVSRLVGGGNTITFRDAPKVYNTDVPGFVRACRHRGITSVATAAIVGNGATARSLLVALAGLSVKQVTVLVRNLERARPMVELGMALGIDTAAVPLHEAFLPVELLASTVPTSATSDRAEHWAGRAEVLFDAVYDPWPTPLAAAADPQQVVITGLELLAGQAVDQFELLTGHPLDLGLALSAAQTELEGRLQA
ncbi:MAG: shikimate dehydrogenase [Propionibacteriaceae bacterium]|nr:shikimate dehydrogenase [Propionibacteriaceae bacterium]